MAISFVGSGLALLGCKCSMDTHPEYKHDKVRTGCLWSVIVLTGIGDCAIGMALIIIGGLALAPTCPFPVGLAIGIAGGGVANIILVPLVDIIPFKMAVEIHDREDKDVLDELSSFLTSLKRVFG